MAQPGEEKAREPLQSSTGSETDIERPVLDEEKPTIAQARDDDNTPASTTDVEPGVSPDDPDVVDWDGPDDAQNPYNWSTWLKVVNCTLISSLTFVAPLASSMFAPGVPELLREFGSTSTTLASFCVSVYVLGFAAGPMIFAPLSELYGRVPIYHVCNVGFVVFLAACGEAPSFNSFIGFRFLSGIFGSCSLSNGGGSIADMIVQEKRGTAMAAYAIGPLLGPIIGPVIGGVVSDAIGWRWVFRILAILGGVLAVVFVFAARETYAPILLENKARKLRKETGNANLRSKLDSGLTPKAYFQRGIVRPFKLIIFSPVCIACGVYIGIAYAYLYVLFTSLTPLFMENYGFNTIEAGLSFLGLGVGSISGLAYFSTSSDRYIKKKAAQEDERAAAEGRPRGGMKPEYRLPPLKLGAIILPVGLFIYGWTAEYNVHWIVPIMGTALIGLGNIVIFMSLQMYLIDTFNIYSASALASNSLMRSLAGAVIPLGGLPMYDALGLGWGNSLLGFIAVVLIPVPWFFMRYGEKIRKDYEIKNL